jgi:Fe2+ or Zn2+ uptake regulation protein
MTKNILEQFNNVMKNNHIKITNERTEVFKIIYASDKALLPKEIIDKTKISNSSSVYRILPIFAKYKILRKVPRGFKTLYELGDFFSRHQHYIVCEKCGASIEFHNEKLEKFVKKITRENKMTPNGHYIELLGICKCCEK